MSKAATAEEAVAREIAGLAGLDRAALAARWTAAFGSAPPPKLSRVVIERALAHEIQCRTFGRLSPAARRALQAAARGGASAPRPVGAGARLVREWNGRTHEVEVVDGGYRWRGQTWRSLSAIAREITGAHWSGPRFFGLADRR